MKCDICKKKEATIHLTKIIEGEVHNINLCEDCAKKQGLVGEGSDVAEFLFSLEVPKTKKEPEVVEVKCEACGFTQSQLKKVGRLGCPECYTAFEDILEEIIKSMHKGNRHVGKVPRAQQTGKTIAEKIKQLQEQLDKAVAVEDYERAAALRDEIKRIRSKLTDGESQE
jgi:protein arginine kinase activator